MEAGYGFNGNGSEEVNRYFYHPDHLGSTSYITNTDGEVCQHVEYIPFGETLMEEHLNSEVSPYLFNGKERDAETGFYYYGARYYDPKISLWLSVDPLFMKTNDNYIFCNQNPIKFVDPDGNSPYDWVRLSNGTMKWDDRVVNERTKIKYYGRSATHIKPDGNYKTYFSGGYTRYYKNSQTGHGVKMHYFNDGTLWQSENQNDTPPVVTVIEDFYIAVKSNNKITLDKTGSRSYGIYKDSKDGFTDYFKSNVTVIDTDNLSKKVIENKGYTSGLYSFFEEYKNNEIKNVYQEKVSYNNLIRIGSAFENVGYGMELVGWVLLPETAGASSTLEGLGAAVSWSGTGMKFYGTYMLGEKDQAFKDLVETALQTIIESKVQAKVE